MEISHQIESDVSSINYSYYKNISHLESLEMDPSPISTQIMNQEYKLDLSIKSKRIIDTKMRNDIIEKNLRISSTGAGPRNHTRERGLSQDILLIKKTLGSLIEDLQNDSAENTITKDRVRNIEGICLKNKKKIKALKSLVKNHQGKISNIEEKLNELAMFSPMNIKQSSSANVFISQRTSIPSISNLTTQKSLRVDTNLKMKSLISLYTSNSPKFRK